MIAVGRNINGISLNGLEYILDENDKLKKFSTKEEVFEFFKSVGEPITQEDINESIITLVDADTLEVVE